MGIGTLGEKALHAMLKQYYEPEINNHEIPVGSFVADIVSGNSIIEIQTRSFDRLREKLAVFLEAYHVTVVYPLPKTKWLLWIDGETGETTKKRKSPKQGSINDAFPELYKIKQFLTRPNFLLCIVMVDLEEYRYLNGWSKDKKKGSTRCDRIPLGIVDEFYFNSPEDYLQFVPEGLQAPFTSKDYMKAAGISLHVSQRALNILHHMGVVERVGKQGNLLIYERS